MRSNTAAVLAVLVMTAAAAAQCRLATTFLGGNNSRGCMFDIVATQPIVVTGFEQNLASGTHGVQIYTKAGTWVGSQNTPGAWTLLGSASGITSAGAGLPTPIPIPFNTTLLVGPGAIRAFYITTTTATTVLYSNGTSVGAPIAQDAWLSVLEGCGINYPFAGNAFQPRKWNGRILYHPAGLPEWQVNQPGASVTMNDIQGTPCEPARLHRTICSAGGGGGTTFMMEVSGTQPGAPCDVIFTAVPAIPFSAGAGITQSVQLVNLDLSDPMITPLFGSSGAPFANATAPINVPFPIDTTFQMVVADPLAPDGAWISQANEIHVTLASGPTPTPGPAADDAFTTHAFAALPCGPQSFPFYGISHATFSVVSNGRVMFGTPVADYQPTITAARTQSPSINAWVDLNPDAPSGGGGAISINVLGPQVVSIDWAAVPYYGNPASANTFSIILDTASGSITLDNISTFNTVTGTLNMFLGLSPGGPLAPNPGPTPFAPGSPFGAASGNAMAYQFGPTGTLAAAVTGIVFMPSPTGGYAWAAY